MRARGCEGIFRGCRVRHVNACPSCMHACGSWRSRNDFHDECYYGKDSSGVAIPEPDLLKNLMKSIWVRLLRDRKTAQNRLLRLLLVLVASILKQFVRFLVYFRARLQKQTPKSSPSSSKTSHNFQLLIVASMLPSVVKRKKNGKRCVRHCRELKFKIVVYS